MDLLVSRPESPELLADFLCAYVCYFKEPLMRVRTADDVVRYNYYEYYYVLLDFSKIKELLILQK